MKNVDGVTVICDEIDGVTVISNLGQPLNCIYGRKVLICDILESPRKQEKMENSLLFGTLIEF
jgi:hypothetical protein